MATKTNKYEQLVNELPALVGDVENISYFTHCITRLRFNLKDTSKVQMDAIKKLPGALGVQWSGDQLQVIIGNGVHEVYEMICKKTGLALQGTVSENLDGTKKKFTIQGFMSGMVEGLVGSITPLIPMLIGGGMIKVIALIMSLVGVPAENPTYMIFNWMGSAFLYFLPVYLGATAAKKFGASQCLGMLLGGFLVLPGFVSAVSSGTALTIFGLPVYAGSYSSSILPVILSVWVLSKIEKFLNKHIPEILRGALAPTISIILMMPIMLVITAPLGFYIGKYVGDAVIWIYDTLGFVGVAILAAFKPLLTMTGMHLSFLPICINSFSTYGYDPFYCPASIYANINQAAACLAVCIRAKGKALKSTSASAALSAFLPGVSEPAMFGVTIRYKTPMIAAIIGGAVSGCISGLLKVVCNTLPGNTGILALPCFISENSENLIGFIIALAAGAVVTFIMTLVLGFKEEDA